MARHRRFLEAMAAGVEFFEPPTVAYGPQQLFALAVRLQVDIADTVGDVGWLHGVVAKGTLNQADLVDAKFAVRQRENTLASYGLTLIEWSDDAGLTQVETEEIDRLADMLMLLDELVRTFNAAAKPLTRKRSKDLPQRWSGVLGREIKMLVMPR